MKRETLPSELGSRGKIITHWNQNCIYFLKSPQQASNSGKAPSLISLYAEEKRNIKHKERIKCWFWVFRHPNYLWVMSCESPAAVKRENETTELPHLSGAVGRGTIPMGTHMGPASCPPSKPPRDELKIEKRKG